MVLPIVISILFCKFSTLLTPLLSCSWLLSNHCLKNCGGCQPQNSFPSSSESWEPLKSPLTSWAFPSGGIIYSLRLSGAVLELLQLFFYCLFLIVYEETKEVNFIIQLSCSFSCYMANLCRNPGQSEASVHIKQKRMSLLYQRSFLSQKNAASF